MAVKEKIYNIIADAGIWGMIKLFPEYFATEPLRPTDRYIEYPWVIKQLPKKGKILDIGCSSSMFPILLSSFGYDVTGIDVREYHPQKHFIFVKGNISSTMFPDKTFDAITAVSTIEHIGIKGRYGVEEMIEGDILALKEVHRILKPKGIFLMTVPYGDKEKITLTHRIYDCKRIHEIFKEFQYQFIIEDSPETKDYDLALIRAEK